MGITRRQLLFIFLGLLFLILSVSAQETIDTEKNLKILSNSGVYIITNNVISCKWSDPKSSWKQCEAVFEINNTNAVDIAFKNAGGALSNIAFPMLYAGRNMQYYFSATPVPTKTSIVNQTCYSKLNLTDFAVLKSFDEGKLCRYSYTRNTFSDWKPIADFTKLPNRASIGLKLVFESPITSSAGKYIPNQFNFSLSHIGGTLTIDPAIADCSELNVAFSTYILTADIPNSADINACMNITANNIILDCGGHLVDGQDAGSTYGADVTRGASTDTNVTIKNCTFTDWERGAGFVKANDNMLYNNSFYSNVAGLYLEASNNNTAYNNSASSGTTVGGYAMLTTGSNNNLFYNDTAYNTYYGFFFNNNAKNNTVYNSASNDNDVGFNLDPSHNNTIYSSIITSNLDVGIFIRVSDNNSFYNNTENDTDYGFYLDTSDNNTISNSTFSLNGNTGIYVDTSVNNIFTDITTNGNTAGGIYSGTSDGNNFTNVISNGNDMGIYIEFSTDHVFTNVSMAGNNQYGFLLESSNNNTITNTTASTTTFNGMTLVTSDNNFITHSTINSNAEGIFIDHSDDGIFFGITASNNADAGIYLEFSDNNTISNLVTNTDVYGLYLNTSSINAISDVISDGASDWAAYGIYANNSAYLTIDNCTLPAWGFGIFLEGTANSTITNCTMSNGVEAVWLEDAGCRNITITGVSTSNNNDPIMGGESIYAINCSALNITNHNSIDDLNGIVFQNTNNSYVSNSIVRVATGGGGGPLALLTPSVNNTISGNEFQGNAIGTIGLDSTTNIIYNNLFNASFFIFDFPPLGLANNWNTTNQFGTRIYSGGHYIGGNYYTNSSGLGFSDICADTNKDGFCDMPYDLMGNATCTTGIDCSNNTDFLALSNQYLAPSGGGIPNGGSSTTPLGNTASNVTPQLNLNIDQSIDLGWLNNIIVAVRKVVFLEYGKIPFAWLLLAICISVVYFDVDKKGRVGNYGKLAGMVFVLTLAVYLKVI